MSQSYKACPTCSQPAPMEAQFCPQCRHQYRTQFAPSNVSRAQYLPLPAPTTGITLICPFCKTHNIFQIDETQSSHTPTCPRCNKSFLSRIVKVRSKTSRGSKKEARRTFSIRVCESSGVEDFIEFVNAGYDDFELRSKDVAVFSYKGGALTVVQNLTIGRSMNVSTPSCYVATYVYGADSDEGLLLRGFRDHYLLPSPLLPKGVTAYYWASQKALSNFGDHALFKALCRVLLTPVVRVGGILSQMKRCSGETF